MRGLTLACIVVVVAVSQAMTLTTGPIAPVSTSTINPLLQSRIDSETTRLTSRLQNRIRRLQLGSGRLDRSIAFLQSELDFNNGILADLPELVKSILINNPTQRLSSRTVSRLIESLQNAATGVGGESAESAEVEDRRRRAVFEITSSVLIVEGTTDSPVTTTVPEVTTQEADTTTVMETTTVPEMTTQEADTTTVMETTTVPEMTTQEADTTTVMETTATPEITSTVAETTTEMTTQGTTLSPFLVARINSVVSRIGRFFLRRVQRIQRSLSRLGRFRGIYRRLIDENASALEYLPLLVRDLITSPFQRRLRLSQVFRALRLRLANNTTPSQIDESQVLARKRRQAESAEAEGAEAEGAEVDDDLVGDMEDLIELEEEVQEELEEVEKLDF